VTVSDGHGGTTTVTVPVTVTAVNDAPVASDSAASTLHDTPITVMPVVSDVDGDVLTVTSATASNGTVTVNPDGSLTFTPDAGYIGPAVITCTVSDGHGGTTTATINISVTATPEMMGGTYPAPTPEHPLTLPAVSQGLTAEGMVDQAANAAAHLNHIYTQADVRGLIDAVVNSFGSLHGTGALTVDGDILHTVNAMNQGSGAADRGGEITTFRGGSSAYFQDAQSNAPLFSFEATVHNGVIYMHVVDLAHGKIKEFRVTRADGRALPDSVQALQGGVLVMRPVGDERLIDLKITAVFEDGSVIVESVQVDLTTGSVAEVSGAQETPHAALFTDQLNGDDLALEDAQVLVRALEALKNAS
jgi:hypothetical protein